MSFREKSAVADGKRNLKRTVNPTDKCLIRRGGSPRLGMTASETSLWSCLRPSIPRTGYAYLAGMDKPSMNSRQGILDISAGDTFSLEERLPEPRMTYSAESRLWSAYTAKSAGRA